MKWFVYIFSLYLLVLSGFTCNASDDCCQDEFKTEANGHTEDDDHKPVSPCIPFFACGACHNVLTPQIGIEFPEPFIPEVKVQFYYGEASFTGLAFAFWQPPQVR